MAYFRHPSAPTMRSCIVPSFSPSRFSTVVFSMSLTLLGNLISIIFPSPFSRLGERNFRNVWCKRDPTIHRGHVIKDLSLPVLKSHGTKTEAKWTQARFYEIVDSLFDRHC